MYQKHNHSKTCRKYKNVGCRFSFGQFFKKRTIIAEALNENIGEEVRSNILNRRKEILWSVKNKIDKVSNPSTEKYGATYFDRQRHLNFSYISEDENYWALSISSDSDFDLHIKRPIDTELFY